MPSLQDLLADLASRDEIRAEAAASLLASHGDAAISGLGGLLESPDADLRWWAIRTLAGMPQPPKDWLRRALGDVSTEVRAAAALALVSHPDDAAVPQLVSLLGDVDNLVAILAVRALVTVGGPAVATLLDAFDRSQARQRIQIMRALSEIRDPRSIALMMNAMSEDSAVLHYWAQQGLESMGLNMVYLLPE